MHAASGPSAKPHPLRGPAARAMLLAAGLTLLAGVTTCAVLLIALAWSGQVTTAQLAASLGPAALVLVGVLVLAVLAARRRAAPLEALVRYAERLAGQERPELIDLARVGEFKNLASAFNLLNARLDASMRRIQELAFVDPVTQLPNQDRFQQEVGLGLTRLVGENLCSMVAVFELQRLSRHIQMLEPCAAKDLMRVVGERFALAVRTTEAAAKLGGARTARLGADQFAVFLPVATSPADALRFAQLANAKLNEPFDWRGHTISAGGCCGAALAPRDGRDAETMIRRARIAAGVADRAPARVRMFSADLDREAAARLTLEREMRGALERNEFRAYFQPKLNLRSGKVDACEALARWVRADQAIVGPARFIPVAEESGLIGQLSDAILREACWKAASWARAGRPANVAVNVSALQLRSDRFAEGVLRTVEHAGLSPSCLELEITESVAMGDPERTARVIGPLREAGVRMAIDDFGCGHSSLATLSKLPFDVIKIDQQFVRALERGDSQAAAIIDMILALARTLGMEVVAEGVERRTEAEFMAARGCHWAQGFLYGAAVSAADFAELLRRQAEGEAAATDAA